MISIKPINEKDIDLCFELDSNTISLWSKKQWANEFKKEGIKVFGLLFSNLIIGICVFHVVLDEAQINFFVYFLNNQNIVLNHFCMPCMYDLNSFLHFQDNLYNFLVILYSVFSSLRSNLLCKPESNKVIMRYRTVRTR